MAHPVATGRRIGGDTRTTAGCPFSSIRKAQPEHGRGATFVASTATVDRRKRRLFARDTDKRRDDAGQPAHLYGIPADQRMSCAAPSAGRHRGRVMMIAVIPIIRELFRRDWACGLPATTSHPGWALKHRCAFCGSCAWRAETNRGALIPRLSVPRYALCRHVHEVTDKNTHCRLRNEVFTLSNRLHHKPLTLLGAYTNQTTVKHDDTSTILSLRPKRLISYMAIIHQIQAPPTAAVWPVYFEMKMRNQALGGLHAIFVPSVGDRKFSGTLLSTLRCNVRFHRGDHPHQPVDGSTAISGRTFVICSDNLRINEPY